MLAWARCHTWRGLDTDAPTRRRPRRRAKEPASVPVVSNGVRLPRWRRSIRAAPDQTSQARLTNEALRNGIQGTVVLEAIVTGDGWPSQIRVVWTAAASMRKPWRQLPNGDLSLAVWRARRSMCSSRSWSTSEFGESCEALQRPVYTNLGFHGAVSARRLIVFNILRLMTKPTGSIR